MFTEKIKNNYPLSDLSTYKIGGPAEYFVLAEEKSDIEAAFAFAKENNLIVTILGGGSNVLINDQGIKGLVIKLHNTKLEISDDVIVCGAGLEVKAMAEVAFEKNLIGVEWSIGIPGSMGGAIRGNAGAHGGSFDQVVRKVEVFKTDQFSWTEFTPDDCGFAYRHSIFKENPNWLIWETTLRLKASDGKSLMKQKMDEYRAYRRTSQPKEPSAGCIFKNFMADDLIKINPSLVEQAQKDNKIRGGKIGAGYLIERLNLKGTIIGGAKISEQHANFLVNFNQAKASDVVALIKLVKDKVKEEFNVEMEEEVQYLGF